MSDAASLPFVSVLVPIRNEAAFVSRLIAALIEQDYPADRLEIIVADGMSTDGTRELLTDLKARHPTLTVIDNPGRIVSTGLNAALAVSRGDVVVRIDGHALPARDFVTQNVALLSEHPEAWSVGGPIRHTAFTPFGKAVAIAMSHPLGVGNAWHRRPYYEGYAEGTAFPAIRRWVFDRISTFDVHLVRNQDDEFNYRINRAGGKVYISPRVRYAYFVREHIGQLFTQYFQYGFWRIPVIVKHHRPASMRQLVPLLFQALCVLFASVGWFFDEAALAFALPAAYSTALLCTALATIAREGAAVSLRLPAAIATMHAAYAFGTAYGLWARYFRPTAWDTDGEMAAISR